MSLADSVRQRRGEFGDDTRPNKGLDPDRLLFVLQGYPLINQPIDIARHGIRPTWKKRLPPQRKPPKNHGSASLYKSALSKCIRQGQTSGTYLIVNISLHQQWNIHCSPFGAVPKKDIDPQDEVRPIHDLSYPANHSTNAYLDKEYLPAIDFTSVVAIARRIEELAQTYPGVTIKILKGDVKSAFRHLMLHAEHVCWMGATLPCENALVIDLAAPFGWSGSPAFYSIFGRAISWLVSQNSPASVSESSDDEPFFGYEWVDDHFLIDPDRDSRLELAETTLRLSMMAILGPNSINESKFSTWSTEQQALGLVWNTNDRTVSMPFDKIQKCIGRVSTLLDTNKVRKQQLQQLLGSLRHITLCLRFAKPFFQELHITCTRPRPFQTIQLSDVSRRDLQWLYHILMNGHLDKLPIRFFGDLPPPTLNFYMDASSLGLAVLHPAKDEYIRLEFDSEELRLIDDAESTGFTINVREHFCMALAAWCWGLQFLQDFRYPHVVCWSDNVSAVSWINRMHSVNEFGREINRAIGLAEAIFKFRMSANHLPGAINRMADAGSRSLSSTHSDMWSTLLSSWQQVQVPGQWRHIYKKFSETYNQTHWPSRQSSGTKPPGGSGPGGAPKWSSIHGFPTTKQSLPDRLYCLQSTATVTEVEPPSPKEIHYRPSCPRSALLRGIIGKNSVSTSASFHTTSWPSKEFIDFNHLHDPSNQSLSPFFEPSIRFSISRQPMTVSYGGLREYLSDGKLRYRFAIRRSDVTFHDQEGHRCTNKENVYRVQVNFRGGKNDQVGVGVSRSLTSSSTSWCCPVRALWFLVEHHCSISENPDEVLCKVGRDQFLQVRDVNRLIKAAAKMIGGAAALFAAGVNRLTIKLFGRWRSSTYERYTRINDQVTTTMASKMVQSWSNACSHSHYH
ncbi:hypothetical protein PHMEG_0008033 [Phytophthora megakarya]|uniref:Reverse transcriptase n=1 Tax=Phytophthora megakarya TaxID=4795 RepID=A0A225WLQ6_9STRA|nr:hypothetical protein PHMEG_0008033 [Phytophthora megakarya]